MIVMNSDWILQTFVIHVGFTISLKRWNGCWILELKSFLFLNVLVLLKLINIVLAVNSGQTCIAMILLHNWGCSSMMAGWIVGGIFEVHLWCIFLQLKSVRFSLTSNHIDYSMLQLVPISFFLYLTEDSLFFLIEFIDLHLITQSFVFWQRAYSLTVLWELWT